MVTETIIGLVILAGGVWMFQDGLASILWYLGKPEERWCFNHAVRLFRCCWGLIFIASGGLLVWGV